MGTKTLIKRVLSYVLNPIAVLRLKSIGTNVEIGGGLIVGNTNSTTIGNNVTIGRGARLSTYVKGEIIIEDGCFIGQYFSAITAEKLEIRKNTLIASFVAVVGENHGNNPELGIRYGDQALEAKPVTIGENCWLGEKVIVLPGVTIGDWSIVGAGSVVNKDIPSYSIAVGNPAKVIKRYNFEKHIWERV